MNTFADLFNVVNPYIVVLYAMFIGAVSGWYFFGITRMKTVSELSKSVLVDLNLRGNTRNELWLSFIVIGISLITIFTGGGAVEYICSLTGVIGAYLVARGKSSSYIWGFISTALYIWVSYKYKLYGETITYSWIFLPLQVSGMYFWMKNTANDGTDVIKKVMSTKQRVCLVIGSVLAIAAYAYFLKFIRGDFPGLDAATSILSIIATVMMVKRYAEQWLVWITVNICAVIMWVQAVLKHENQGYAILAMWVLYLLNAAYGWYKWRKGEVDESAKRVSST